MGQPNCWEVKRCGREPEGRNAVKLGVCPAAVASARNGVNGGRNGGRTCWQIAGTLCGGKVQGTYAQKLPSCMECSFYQQVWRDEG